MPIVSALSPSARKGQLKMGTRRLPCLLGRAGRLARKREGDGATPIGQWPMLEVLYRADRVARPVTRLPVRPIQQTDGWCDAPKDRNYNRPVAHPYPASAETMWREDHLYDIVVVLDYNISRRTRNRGSAIFMHLMSEIGAPTEGCIALCERDLRLLLRHAKPSDRLFIRPG